MEFIAHVMSDLQPLRLKAISVQERMRYPCFHLLKSTVFKWSFFANQENQKIYNIFESTTVKMASL